MVNHRWARTSLNFFLFAFRNIVYPPRQDRSLRRSSYFCRHHLDWISQISLRHSVLTNSSVLRLALASMRSGQPKASHPRNLYGSVGRSAGRAARQPKQRVDGRRVARPAGAAPHGLAVSLLAGIRREVVRVGVAAYLKCRGGMHGFIRIE